MYRNKKYMAGPCFCCGGSIYKGTGIPYKRIHKSCADLMPYDLRIVISDNIKLEVKTRLMSRKQLSKTIRLWMNRLNNYNKEKE